MAPRSLLDGADLARLRPLVAPGGLRALAAVLVDGRALQVDPADPSWGDRDRLVTTVAALPQLVARLRTMGADPAAVVASVATGGAALGMALGAAAASAADGGVWRTWCVLDARATDDGGVWEAARAAADADLGPLVVLGAGHGDAALWSACGWSVHTARTTDPALLFAAVDRALADTPAAVLT